MSAGRDVRGIKRGHQFDKVEMYIFCKPEESDAMLEKMLPGRRADLRRAGLTYRVKQLCTGDLGFRRAHDLRPRGLGAGLQRVAGGLVGLERGRFPGPAGQYQVPPGRWRQAALRAHPERLGAGHAAHPDRRAGELPAGRWQSIVVPEVLRPWMGGIDVIALEFCVIRRRTSHL